MTTVKVERTAGEAATVVLTMSTDDALDLVNFLGMAQDHAALRLGSGDVRFNAYWQRKNRLLEMIYDGRKQALGAG